MAGKLELLGAGEIGKILDTSHELVVRGWRDPSRVRTPLKLISFPPLSSLKYLRYDLTVNS